VAHRRAGAADPDGVVVVDKPGGWTSHDVVARARSRLGCRRAGHAGTLDPGATGVLVVGVGRATRLLRFASALEKSYTGELVLGVATSTLDATGEVVATYDMAGVTPAEVAEAAARLTGQLLQVPPMVSALKVGGRRLYSLARAGIEVERQPRRVHVARFAVAAADEPGVYAFEVTCSSGTYVRSLVADLGASLGGGAHLRCLRRVAVGRFTLEGAVALEDLSAAHLEPPSALVAHLPALAVDDDVAGALRHGRVLERRALKAVGDGPWALYGPEGGLLAVYERLGRDRAKPAVVLAGPAGPAAGAGSLGRPWT